MSEWLSDWDWGSVPDWLGVVLAVAIPLTAYLSRNRIAGFVKRKNSEPAPALPPARWLLGPTTIAGYWVLTNSGAGSAYNVQMDSRMQVASVRDSGFWAYFPSNHMGTVSLHVRPDSDRAGFETEFGVTWQDANSETHSFVLEVLTVENYKNRVAISPQAPGQVVPATDIKVVPAGEST